jgi:hypothetical protein
MTAVKNQNGVVIERCRSVRWPGGVSFMGRAIFGGVDERAAFEARATIRYLDTGHLRRIQHQYLRERADARRAAAC